MGSFSYKVCIDLINIQPFNTNNKTSIYYYVIKDIKLYITSIEISDDIDKINNYKRAFHIIDYCIGQFLRLVQIILR